LNGSNPTAVGIGRKRQRFFCKLAKNVPLNSLRGKRRKLG